MLVLVVLALAVSAALGAVLLRMDLPEMVEEAQVICLGRVAAIESEWDEHRGVIYSFATIKLQRIIKGDGTGDTLVVRYLGGKVGDVGMSVPGAPSFRTDEDVLLFLTAEEDGSYSVMGMSQGKYEIELDEDSGIAYAKPDLSGVMFLGEEGKMEMAPVPLQEMVTWIEELLGSAE